jgi:hypothetical protein
MQLNENYAEDEVTIFFAKRSEKEKSLRLEQKEEIEMIKNH